MYDREKLLNAFKSTKGIVDHEFPQEIIDACHVKDQARQQRILEGETTFEEEDAALMAEWRKLKNSSC